jgi:hypothetical protein
MNLKKIAVAAVVGFAALSAAWGDDLPMTSAKPAATKNCLNADMVDHTSIVDDQNILYVMINDKIWRNHLDSPCTDLRLEDGFATEVWAGQICVHQPITVVRTRNKCFLGTFVAEDTGKADTR